VYTSNKSFTTYEHKLNIIKLAEVIQVNKNDMMKVRNQIILKSQDRGIHPSLPDIKALTEGYFLLIQIVGAERERKAIP